MAARVLLPPGGPRGASQRSERREDRTRRDGKPIKGKSNEAAAAQGGSTVSALQVACILCVGVQLLLELGDIAEALQLKALRRQMADLWRIWEPERIRRTLALQTYRVEPAEAIFLWAQNNRPGDPFAQEP